MAAPSIDSTTVPPAVGEWVAVSKLIPWLQNPRLNDHVVDAIADSIRRFGFGNPILARSANGEVIAGHTRLKAALKLGMTEVPVRYLDLSAEDAHLLALADNKLGEKADWDDQAVAAILAGYAEQDIALAGFDPAMFDVPGEDGDDDVDLTPPERPESVLGEVYELGPHRLVCGDATDPAVWAKLLGDERANLVWTDPPYGVSYTGKTREALTINNDDLSPDKLHTFLTAVLALGAAHSEPGAAWYVAAPAGPLFGVFGDVLARLGVWRHTLTWVKDQFVMGRCDYHYRHEPIFYGWTPGGPHYWAGSRKLDSVLEFARPRRSEEHPTMKPVELVQHCLANSSKAGAIVVDPFGGSGTTLIAAARERRRARLIELDPRYCDVIRRRWSALEQTTAAPMSRWP